MHEQYSSHAVQARAHEGRSESDSGSQPDSPDVRALLWEVARLRALALRMHDYFRQGSSSTATVMGESLRMMLEDEPVMQEQPKL
jgi:hypothetical protein